MVNPITTYCLPGYVFKLKISTVSTVISDLAYVYFMVYLLKFTQNFFQG